MTGHQEAGIRNPPKLRLLLPQMSPVPGSWEKAIGSALAKEHVVFNTLFARNTHPKGTGSHPLSQFHLPSFVRSSILQKPIFSQNSSYMEVWKTFKHWSLCSTEKHNKRQMEWDWTRYYTISTKYELKILAMISFKSLFINYKAPLVAWYTIFLRKKKYYPLQRCLQL